MSAISACCLWNASGCYQIGKYLSTVFSSAVFFAKIADAFKDDIDRCMVCGMNDHLKKPIEMEKVLEVL